MLRNYFLDRFVVIKRAYFIHSFYGIDHADVVEMFAVDIYELLFLLVNFGHQIVHALYRVLSALIFLAYLSCSFVHEEDL